MKPSQRAREIMNARRDMRLVPTESDHKISISDVLQAVDEMYEKFAHDIRCASISHYEQGYGR